MNNFKSPAKKLFPCQNKRGIAINLPILIAFTGIMLFSTAATAQPVLIDANKTCSSLDRLNVEGCYQDALNFDGNRLSAAVADLYTSPNLPITASLEYVTADPGNGYCGWVFTYTYRIRDAAQQSVNCDVTYSGSDQQKPVFTVPPDITLYQTDSCNLDDPHPDISGNVTDAYDNCGIFQVIYVDCGERKGPMNNQSLSNCTGPCLGQRIIERKWIVRDSCGNETEGIQKIFITDTIRPVFTVFPANITTSGCENITYDVDAIDNCNGPVSFTYSFSGATTGSGSGTGSGSTFNLGITTVTITVTDCSGNSSERSFTINSTCDKGIVINISAGTTTTIYKGLTPGGQGPFGPQSINLCSNISGGTPPYTYSWSPAAGLNNPYIANPIANPAATTTYVLLVTDHLGHTSTLSITINVLPLSSVICTGNGNNVKYRVCHIPPGNPANQHNICISANALNAHLISGSNGHNNCHLGYCGQQLCFTNGPGGCQLTCQPSGNSPEENPDSKSAEVITTPEEFAISVFPNPTLNEFRIQVFSKSNQPVLIKVLDNNGNVKSIGTFSSLAGAYRVGGDLPRGVYTAEVIQGNNRKAVKLVKIN